MLHEFLTHNRTDLIERCRLKVAQRSAPPVTSAELTHGIPLSDDFTTNKFGVEWGFYDPAPDEMQRVRYDNGTLVLKAKGTEPRDCSPLTCIVGDQAYQFEADLQIDASSRAIAGATVDFGNGGTNSCERVFSAMAAS